MEALLKEAFLEMYAAQPVIADLAALEREGFELIG